MNSNILGEYGAQAQRLIAMHAQAPRSTGGTVQEKVLSRMSNALMGSQLQAMTISLLGDNFKSAPLQNPAISTGMTDTLKKLKAILTRSQEIDEDEYLQVR